MAKEAKVKTITIAAVIDVVGVLATDSTEGQVYFMDTNKDNGSLSQGTEYLKTAVTKGDKVVWMVQPLECEAYTAIDDIIIDKDYCEPEKKTYEGTDISFWVGTIKKDITMIPYSVKFKVGTRAESIGTNPTLCLVGQSA